MGLARLLACGSVTVTLLAASAAAADSHEVANPACKAAHHLVGGETRETEYELFWTRKE